MAAACLLFFLVCQHNHSQAVVPQQAVHSPSLQVGPASMSCTARRPGRQVCTPGPRAPQSPNTCLQDGSRSQQKQRTPYACSCGLLGAQQAAPRGCDAAAPGTLRQHSSLNACHHLHAVVSCCCGPAAGHCTAPLQASSGLCSCCSACRQHHSQRASHRAGHRGRQAWMCAPGWGQWGASCAACLHT